MKTLVLILASGFMLSGCVLLDKNRDLVRAQSESNPAGAKGLLRGDELRALSIANLVGSFVPGWEGVETKTERDEQRETDRAIAAFYRMPDATTGVGAVYRNEIQSRIMAAANQRCQLWKNYIATASSTVGFWSGVVSAASGASAIAFSPEGTKDALTALSTTSSAVGDQFDKEYLFSLTMPVIVQGVESRRSEISDSISERRYKAGEPASLANYALSAAIADALEYHAACSLSSGLQQASEKLADARKGQAGSGATPAPDTPETKATAGAPTAQAAAPAENKPAALAAPKRTSSPAT